MSLDLDLPIPYPPDEAAKSSRGPSVDLEALHVEFYDRLVRLCTQRLRDHGLAEDIAQDTILRARRFWDTYDNERPTWPWLKTIAVRLCLDASQVRSREVYPGAVPEQPDAIDRTERLLDKLTVQGALAELPERQRLALQLRYLDDRDRDSSAEVLGVTVNAFDQLINRARLRLASLLDPNGPGAPLASILLPVRWLRRCLQTGWLPRWAASGFAPMTARDAPIFVSAAACLVCVALPPDAAAGTHVGAPRLSTLATHSFLGPHAITSRRLHPAIIKRSGRVKISSGVSRPESSKRVPETMPRKHTTITVIEHPPSEAQTRICIGVPALPAVCVNTPQAASAGPDKTAAARQSSMPLTPAG